MEAVAFILGGSGQMLGAFGDMHVAGGAVADSPALMLDRDPVAQGKLENRIAGPCHELIPPPLAVGVTMRLGDEQGQRHRRPRKRTWGGSAGHRATLAAPGSVSIAGHNSIEPDDPRRRPGERMSARRLHRRHRPQEISKRTYCHGTPGRRGPLCSAAVFRPRLVAVMDADDAAEVFAQQRGDRAEGFDHLRIERV